MPSLILLLYLLYICSFTIAAPPHPAADLIPAPLDSPPPHRLARRSLVLSNGGVHTLPTSPPPLPSGVLTIVTIEFGPPVTVTSQRQLVPSYVPVLTICPLGAAASSSASAIPSGFSNSTDLAQQLEAALPPSVPYMPVVAKRHLLPRDQGTSSECSTSFSSTLTPICATTLSPLAAPVIPVTECDQNVTFSSQMGYSVVGPTVTGDSSALMVRRRDGGIGMDLFFYSPRD